MDSCQNFLGRDGSEAFFLLLNAGLQFAAPAVDLMVNNFMVLSPGKPDARPVARGKNRYARGTHAGS